MNVLGSAEQTGVRVEIRPPKSRTSVRPASGGLRLPGLRRTISVRTHRGLLDGTQVRAALTLRDGRWPVALQCRVSSLAGKRVRTRTYSVRTCCRKPIWLSACSSSDREEVCMRGVLAILICSLGFCNAVTAADLEQKMNGYFAIWDSDAAVNLPAVENLYASRVDYYGHPMTPAQIYFDKLNYIRKWPFRNTKSSMARRAATVLPLRRPVTSSRSWPGRRSTDQVVRE